MRSKVKGQRSKVKQCENTHGRDPGDEVTRCIHM